MRDHVSSVEIFLAAINSLTNSSQYTKTIRNQKSDRRVICFDETRPIETMHGASQLKYCFIAKERYRPNYNLFGGSVMSVNLT
jgi:hypothetical protein